MKICFFLSLMIIGIVPHSNAQSLISKSDSLSYALGLLLAQGANRQDIQDLNFELLALAINDYLNGEKTLMSVSSANIAMQKHSEEKSELVKIEEEKKSMENKTNCIDFLADNAERIEVTTLPSGLQYEILIEGTGESPTVNDKVTCHYEGTLVDGTVFDSSIARGEPLTFSLQRVIKAWQEAIPMMKVGSKWKIYAPYQLAYGERAVGEIIKAYSALIFEVELLDFTPGQ